jgi:Ca-activated chloride channel family protein
VLRGLVRDIRHGLVDGNGTAIGNALGVATNRLRRTDAKSRIIVLVTDGDSNRGNISPKQAADFAKLLKIKVFTVLVGQHGAQPDSSRSPFRRRRRKPKYPVNPKLLEQIAAMTGGQAYTATDDAALQQRFHALLETLDKARIHDVVTTYAERYRLLVMLALLLVGLEVLLLGTRLRRFP